jgi:peptide/nickel transport system ATP-binding protein/oligopeptide transport system ATP-binding protein
MSEPVLAVRSLRVTFPGRAGRVAVVDGVNFSVEAGRVLALVGESGCGKSMTALSCLRLIPKPGQIEPESDVRLRGRSLLGLSAVELRAVRGAQLAMIFQEPMTSLNPVQRVGDQVSEAIRLHEPVSGRAARERVLALFQRVGIPDARARLEAYPHQLSGGLKQRVMIAMAVALRPLLLIADEPTTALDVTVQAQILDLMRELQAETSTAILLITHDFGVVNELADDVAVMYGGRIVERGTRREILTDPRHPYTVGLLRSIPALTPRGARLQEIAGVVPSPEDWPRGCPFATRCPRVFDPCAARVPAARWFSEEHSASCHALEAPRGEPAAAPLERSA